MEWTRDKPTEPGWYWCRRDDECDLVSVEPTAGRGRLEAWWHGHKPTLFDSLPLHSMDSFEWYGPLEPPP
jgi:hypothetical protein